MGMSSLSVAVGVARVFHVGLMISNGGGSSRWRQRRQQRRRWYATGTLSTHRLKPAKAFRHILVKYAECWCDDTSHMQSQWHIPLHSYASNHNNARRSHSVLLIIVLTLISYDTHLSLIIFKIIPHPMTLLTAIPLQVIICTLFNTAYFRSLTITLLICCPVVISRALRPSYPSLKPLLIV
jgi:hypothetical protein